jgi:hypothetical protein
VGGASGKLVEKAWNAGERWLTGYYKENEQKALEQAKSNSLQFLADLAHRVGRLESEAEGDEKTKRQIESALGDPDFSALLKQTIFASARTGNKEKHTLLARIVAERLRANADDLLALSSNMAVRAVENLTPRQTRYLGIVAVAYYVRPYHPFPPGNIPPHNFGPTYAGWLKEAVSLHLPLKTPPYLDLMHLQAAGCIDYLLVTGRPLNEHLGPKADTGYEWPYEDFIKSTEGSQLLDLWNAAIQRTPLTTVGQLVGTYVHDELRGTRTIFHW